MTIHIDTDHGPIPPYAVMLIISFIAGLGVQFLLNARSGVKKSIAGYGTILAPPMAAFFAILVMQIYTGGKGIGVSSVGGALGMYMSAFTMALISRDRICGRVLMESCTVTLPLMYGIAKLGCLMAGCCHGMDYSGPLALEYSGSAGEICVFPVQIAESAVFLVIFIIAAAMHAGRRHCTVPAVILMSAAAKGLLDFLRASHTGKIISLNQIFCITAAVICAGAVIYQMKKSSAEKA